ncbi:MAG: hypothetical protein IT381_12075 [Deltaproteobacteria bacterium]|nr:hypothetical protein [Deltaproteobacteria bacterium]
MVDPTKAQPRVHVRANEHHDGKVDNKKKADAPPKPPPAVVPDFDKVQTHSTKALKNAGPEKHDVSEKTMREIRDWLDQPKIKDPTTLFMNETILASPAVKYWMVNEYGEEKFAKLVVGMPEGKAKRALIEAYGGSISLEAQRDLVRALAKDGQGDSVAAVLTAVAMRNPERLDDLMGRAYKLSHDALIAGAAKQPDGVVMQYLTEHFRRNQLDGGQAPLAGKLRQELFIPTTELRTLKSYEGVSPPDTKIVIPADLDYIAATGDLPPNIEAFIADAKQSKDPDMLKAAKEILELRQVALANRFATQDPAHMSKETLAEWHKVAVAAERMEDGIDKALGKDIRQTSGLATAVFLFEAMKKDDASVTQIYMDAIALKEPDRSVFAQVVSRSIRPSAVDHFNLSVGSSYKNDMLGELIAANEILGSQMSASEKVRILALMDAGPGSVYHRAVVDEARSNPQFRHALNEAAGDAALSKKSADYAKAIMKEGNFVVDLSDRPYLDMQREVTQAMGPPLDQARLNKAMKQAQKAGPEAQREMASYAFHALDGQKGLGSIDKIEPAEMRARVDAEATLSKVKPDRANWSDVDQRLPKNEKARLAFSDQLGAYAAAHPDLAQAAARYAVKSPDETVAAAITKGFGQAGISNQYIAPVLIGDADKARTPDELVTVSAKAKRMLGPTGEQLVARSLAARALKDPESLRTALAQMDPDMAWRVRGEWVRLAAGEKGEHLDKAIALYDEFVKDGKIPRDNRDEFRAGAGELLKDPAIAKKLAADGSKGAKALEDAATARRSPPTPTAGVRSGGAFEA